MADQLEGGISMADPTEERPDLTPAAEQAAEVFAEEGGLPDGWTIATNIEQHVSFIYTGGDNRSIAIIPVSTDADRWKVVGVAKYAPDAPVFTQYVDFADAVATAIDVMQATVDGTADEIEPVRTVTCEFTSDTDNGQNDNDSDSTDDQAALQQFT
jgi:hypothetical protein